MKISIITVCFNDKEGAIRTMNSIRNQTSHQYELIVMDGGSTDGSVEVFHSNSDIITVFESKKDGGVFYAMNDAVNCATGDYCIFMNSGDWFYDEYVLENFINQNPISDIYTGITATHKNNKAQPWYPFKQNAVNILSFWKYGSLSHQSSFIKTSLMKELMYDTKFHIGADTKFFMEALLIHHASYQPLHFMVSNFMSDGMSSDPIKAEQERNAILEDLFGKGIFSKIEVQLTNDWDNVISQVDPNSKFGRLASCVIRSLLSVRKLFHKFK